MSITRRYFLKMLMFFSLMTSFLGFRKKQSWALNATDESRSKRIVNTPAGVECDGTSSIYFVKNGTGEQNIKVAIEMMGGVEKFFGPSDIIILKPNAQRFNQGMTNTDAMKGFIDLILGVKDFSGEIIIAENHQYEDDNCCGWNTDHRNGQFNLNELVLYYNNQGVKNVTKYHWHVAGPCTYPLEGNGQGKSRVKGPEDGDGYVWMEDNYYLSPSGRKCLMTYPVFTSSYSGITIDLKNGAWQDGRYLTDREVRLINFSALNHHGRYAGVSASVKNLMGVVDMTCGFPGDSYPDTYNTHHIGVSRLKHWLRYGHWRISTYRGWLKDRGLDYCYRNFHHTGGVLGHFMTTVKYPDLNIIAADLVGWGDRRDLNRAFKPKALLISTDPVALDYIAAKEVLWPGTPEGETERSGVMLKKLNNPDDHEGPFYKFLLETNRQGVGNLDPLKINVFRKQI